MRGWKVCKEGGVGDCAASERFASVRLFVHPIRFVGGLGDGVGQL